MADTVEKVDIPGCLVDEQSFIDLNNRLCAVEARTDEDDQQLTWDAAACELSLEDGGPPIDISPTVTSGTAAQIRALRNAGDLKPGRTYAISYNRGCLGEATVYLTAQAPDKLGMDALVETSFDNELWEGRYSIDSSRIVELWDNRGNHAQGITGVEVDRFPWGNPRWREVQVISADVFVECDTSLQVYNVRFENEVEARLQGTTGLIYDSSVGDDSQLLLNGADVNIQQLKMASGSRILGDNSTAVIFIDLEMQSDSYWDFRNRNDVRGVSSTMAEGSRVYFTGGNRQWWYQTRIGSRADVRQTNGTIQWYYSTVEQYADINMNSADVWLEYGSAYRSRAIITNNQTARVRGYYNDVRSRGEINYNGTAAVTTYYNDIKGYGRMFITGTTSIVYANELNSQGRVNYSGGTHYRNRFTGLANISSAFNTRSIYMDGAGAYTLTVANSNRGSDYHHPPGSGAPALQ